jgi:hypothetical protein
MGAFRVSLFLKRLKLAQGAVHEERLDRCSYCFISDFPNR